MLNFEYYSPTKVVFGRDVEKETGALVAQNGATKVLVHYGGGSAERSGVLDTVYQSLKDAGVDYVTLGGVVPNPTVEMVRKGAALCKKEKVDFVLAVGGGSVIDSAKGIAYGAVTDADVWRFYTAEATPEKALPVGAVLTLAAAGSELSNSSVLTDEESGEKRGVRNDICRCRFAVMNPQLTTTVPAYHTAAGCADIILHTVERYFTPYQTMQLTDGIAAALVRTVIDSARILTREPENYDARAEVMWASSLSHNDLTGLGGGGGDWACHQLSHVLSARYDMSHGAALTAVWGSWARYVYEENIERFADFAENVMQVPFDDADDEAHLAELGIEALEEFFWALELPTSLAEADIEVTAGEIQQMALQCTYGNTRTIGAIKELGEKEIIDIFTAAQ